MGSRGTAGRYAAAAGILAAALLAGAPLPADAMGAGTGSVEASSHVDSAAPAKEQMLEALNTFRDHGLSVMEITDRIFGTDVLEKSGGAAGEAVSGALESAARKAGNDAADRIAEAGDQVTRSVQDTAKKTAGTFFDTLRERISGAFSGLFKKKTE